ncbi:MAG TPA: dephospho-CoA kinase [Fimbriimonadaceae bacterium]|nr:dephospho-CoA kinase [Fimbriimonadaceae bacterium]HRJ95078.1 dephospho-CoA kinase [Fimbriimonadaceae bacterium]
MRLAITGGIAEGKSTVLGYLAAEGVTVVSADEVAREVFDEPDIRSAIAASLGLKGDAPDFRDVVRSRIAAEPAARLALNSIMHREVLRRLLDHEHQENTAFEVPLLIETCIQRHFDRTWLVTCGGEEQLRRLATRLGDEAEARAMIAMQLPSRVKVAFADRIIRTDQPPSIVHRSAVEALAEMGWGVRG